MIDRKRAVLGGAVAAGVGLGISELIAGILGATQSLVVSMGEWVIEVSPDPVTKWAIEAFGVYDKLVLVISLIVVALAFGGVLGLVARRSIALAGVGFVAFAAAAVLAASRNPLSSQAVALLAGGGAATAGILSLAFLVRPSDTVSQDASRRAFLRAAGGLAAVAAVGGVAGRWLVDRVAVLTNRSDIILPAALEVVDTPQMAAPTLPGLSPLITPNDQFYKIDTALTVPMVDLTTWTMRVTGMVDRPFELTYDDLLELPMVERYVTLSCVSNRVGGDLVGHAKWLGVPLTDILTRARVQDGATQVVGRSVDGFTVGFPTDVAFDGRDAMVAVAMNGEPLPFDHGFPARLVVAGLYGYVSATKWLSEIELTTWESFDAYWIPRNWSKLGPVKTQSRIDRPRMGEVISSGPFTVAGVAWAPNTGISKVEVSADGGIWQECTLGEDLGANSWIQWWIDLDLDAGVHDLQVRATDGSGYTQTPDLAPPRPDGATGWHTVRVQVS